MVEQRRRETGTWCDPGPPPVGQHVRRLLPPQKLEPRPRVPLTDEEIEAREVAAKRRELDRRWLEFVDCRGSRYLECRLGNFRIDNEKQEAAVKLLLEYCENVKANVMSGTGVVLFGPRGTGKDHLAMAVARAAIMAGGTVTWKNGLDLYGDIRDAMGDEGGTESSMVAKLVRPDLLYLSDPLPLSGPMTSHQMSMLFRILDGRYSRQKPLICTVNVSSGAELDERMGPQNADRLKDGALAIYCNWSSYRKAIQ